MRIKHAGQRWFFIEAFAKAFCIQDRFDIATCGHSQLKVSTKADNGPREVYDYLIFARPCVAVKALHAFWVVYPPKASLRSDILEARHHVRSFNLLVTLLNEAQKQSEPLTRSHWASKPGLATNKVLWHGWIDLKACGGRKSLVHLGNYTV